MTARMVPARSSRRPTRIRIGTLVGFAVTLAVASLGPVVGPVAGPVAALPVAALPVAGPAPEAGGLPTGYVDTVLGDGSHLRYEGPPEGVSGLVPVDVAAIPGGGMYVLEEHVLWRLGADGVLRRVAGDGVAGDEGDGGPATSARIGALGVEAAPDGSAYLADTANNRIRHVDAGGTITTVAGQLWAGFSGDGGPAVAARMDSPVDVALDGTGGYYIADRDNRRVRHVDGAGTVTTVAGTGIPGDGGDGGPATAATFEVPVDVAVDGTGRLLVADQEADRVRRIELDGTIGPVGAGTLGAVRGVAVDASGRVLVTNENRNYLQRIALDGTVTTISVIGGSSGYYGGYSGDGGPLAAAVLDRPSGLDVAADGTLLVADWRGGRVRSVAPDEIITTAVGGTTGVLGPPSALELDTTIGGIAALADGDLVFSRPNQVYRYDRGTGIVSTIAGTGESASSGDGGPAVDAALTGAHHLAVGPDDAVYIGGNAEIRRIDPGGTITTVAGGNGTGDSGDGGPAILASFGWVAGLAVDSEGDLYFTDSTNDRARRVDTSGVITTIAGTGTSGYSGDGGPGAAAQLDEPAGIGVRPDGSVLIADTRNDIVRRVAPDGIITTAAGDRSVPGGYTGDGGAAADALLERPGSLHVDAEGRAFLESWPSSSSSVGSLVRMVDATDTVWTVAGNGSPNTGGDGGPARAASFDALGELTVDVAGDLFVVEPDAARIRMVAGPFRRDAPGAGYRAMTPFRLLDSRTDVGGWAGQPLGPGATGAVPAAGVGGIPADATALVLNVTVTGATAGSYLTAFPAGAPPPTAANLLFVPGQTVSNQVTVGLGEGAVSFFNQLGQVHVIADVLGYYGPAAADRFVPTTPERVLDSRDGTGGWTDPLGPDGAADLVLPSLPPDATAAVLNVTVTGGTAPSYLAVEPAGSTPSGTASLLFDTGETTSNLVIVGVDDLGSGPAVTVRNHLGDVDVVADLLGYYTNRSGERFFPLRPNRVLDSRTGIGLDGAWGPDVVRTLATTTTWAVPADARALAANLTGTGPSSATYVALAPTPAPIPAPTTANLLLAAGETKPTAAYVGLGDAATLDLYNQLGSVDLVVDVAGFFWRPTTDPYWTG